MFPTNGLVFTCTRLETQLQRQISDTTRDGVRFGQTEEDFCLRFGLSVNRIPNFTVQCIRRSWTTRQIVERDAALARV